MSQMHGAVEKMAALDDLALLPRMLLLVPSLCCNCGTRAAGARLRRRLCLRTWTWCCWPWMRWWTEGELGGGLPPAAVCALRLFAPCYCLCPAIVGRLAAGISWRCCWPWAGRRRMGGPCMADALRASVAGLWVAHLSPQACSAPSVAQHVIVRAAVIRHAGSFWRPTQPPWPRGSRCGRTAMAARCRWKQQPT